MRTIEATVAAHQSRNRALLKTLAGMGADPFEKRPIDLHFWAISDAGAEALAQALREHGLNPVEVSAAPGAIAKWSVEARFDGSIMEVTAVTFVERYVQLAAENSSEFDGWGTSA